MCMFIRTSVRTFKTKTKDRYIEKRIKEERRTQHLEEAAILATCDKD